MTKQQSLYEINHRAISVLCREIGITNTLRFIRQFSTGYGDYTKERETLLGDKNLEEIMKAIKAKRGA
jgi:hypothetical protein